MFQKEHRKVDIHERTANLANTLDRVPGTKETILDKTAENS